MPLSADRIITPGQTPHAHERDAFDFVVRELPDTDPYRLWAFVDLIDSSGRRYDLDLLILGYHALYLVEVKSHVGTLTGDEVDWSVTFPDGGRTTFENPLRTTTHKARVLSGLLDRRFDRDPDAQKRGLPRPWVQPLIFLAGANLDVNLTPAGGMHVVTRRNFREAITRGEFPGAPDRLRDRFVNRPAAVATQRLLKDMGLRPSIKALKVQDLILRQLLEDGAHYQDHLGVHQSMPSLQRRVRSFIVPANTTAERREQLVRAAKREAQILTTLSDHRHVLRFFDYTAEGPLGGPCVILEHFADALPLDVFLRANPGLPFEDRIAIIQQLAEALEFSHRKQVFHRGLSPRAVLVRRANRDTGPIEVRLYNFQLASTEDTSGTVHISSLLAEQTAVYVAPEVLENPAAADAASDVFSLGAIAYHVLTGQPPGTSLVERAALLATGRLSVAAARDDLAGGQTGRSLENALAPPATVEDEQARLEGSSLDEVVGFATEVNRHNRADSAIAWLNLVLDAATTPAAMADASFVSPLEAAPGQRLSEDLEVVAVLGSGSTARVLRVRRGPSEYALKVAHEPQLEERLHHEARVLRSLEKKDGSGRIVSLVEELTLGGRACLLMTDAGDSLAALIAREGPPSLDFARRWGEDLLTALELLEDNAIQHRDIKPANLGVLSGQAKKKRSLLLFDFSLASTGDAAITVGTPAYRDPFLDRRGRWDAAADRWAAAMTLHELLTGIRPGWGAGDETAAASEGEIRVAAERFDASGNIRPRLTAFFKKALSRDVAARYPSVEAMRIEWVGCFASTEDVAPASEDEAATRVWDFAGIGPQTPIAALALSARAKNALDRAGMTTTAELLQMPRNRLSTTRGIGRQTQQEIQLFADAARAALGERLTETTGTAEVASAFFGECRDPGTVAQVPGLSAEAASALEDAGLGSLSAAAAAPRAQVERVLQPYAEAVQVLLDHLSALRPAAALVAGVPATIEDWLDQLFARREKADKYLVTAAQLLGLEPVPGEVNADPKGDNATGADGAEARDVRGLARRLGVTPAAVYIAFGKARERWRKHPHIGELSARLARILDRLGTVAPLSWIADELVAELPHRAVAGVVPAASASHAVVASVAARALVRIAAESSGDDVVSGRIRQRLWIATGQAPLALARALGERADALAALAPLPSSEEVREALARVIDGTTLVALPTERLIALAAEASVGAARSARLELYPRGMAARRALELSATAIAPREATPEAIRQIVRARYPEAEALPEGEALHPLLSELGFKWEAVQGAYIRPGAELLPSAATVMRSRWSTTHTSHRASAGPRSGGGESEEAIEFEARLRLAVDKRSFRVLDVASGYDNLAGEELGRRFGAQVVSLEGAMLAEVDRLVTEDDIEPALVAEADRHGPAAAEDWQYLCKLMQKAATRAVARLLPPNVAAGRRPVVLLQPGMLARYGLEDVLRDIVARGQHDDAPPIFLVNPTADDAEWARIDSGTQPLTVPIPSQAQRLKVPVSWVENRHRAGAH